MEIGGQRQAPGALPPGKETQYPFYGRLGLVGRRRITPLPGFAPRTVKSVASRYADCAIPALPVQLLQENFWTHRMSSITRRTLPNDIKIPPHITEITAKHL